MVHYLILAAGLAGLGVLIVALARKPPTTGPREFQFEGETYFWVPDDSGRPLFARGANWIPDDCFPSRVTKVRYRERVQQAADANIDLLLTAWEATDA